MATLDIAPAKKRPSRAPTGFSPKAEDLDPVVREGYVAAGRLFLAAMKSAGSSHARIEDLDSRIGELLGWRSDYISRLGFRSTRIIDGVKERLQQLLDPALPRDERFERNHALLGDSLALPPLERRVLRFAELPEPVPGSNLFADLSRSRVMW